MASGFPWKLARTSVQASQFQLQWVDNKSLLSLKASVTNSLYAGARVVPRRRCHKDLPH